MGGSSLGCGCRLGVEGGEKGGRVQPGAGQAGERHERWEALPGLIAAEFDRLQADGPRKVDLQRISSGLPFGSKSQAKAPPCIPGHVTRV
jgi:hypothetical protein